MFLSKDSRNGAYCEKSGQFLYFSGGLDYMMRARRDLHITIWALCVYLTTVFFTATHAQQQVDFSGYITKYDTTFSGIGPKVYFLPPPPTPEEVLDHRYAEKEIDSATVGEYVSRMRYYHRLVPTGNAGGAAKYLPVRETLTASVEGKLWAAAESSLARADLGAVADIHNRLAMEYLAVGDLDLAIEFFKKSMDLKMVLGQGADWDRVAHNLAVTYECVGQLDLALSLRTKLYERALKSQDRNNQARALMELAYVKAKQGRSTEAEQEIIRKVVPLFRQARNDAGLATAYRTLAEVYILQARYPEAQWFLVQAKSIVDKEGLADQLPEIIFSLAEAKRNAGNPQVAIEEYKVADDLARKDHMLGMQLAIQDALGNLYHQAGDYDGAALALTRYDMLKNALFRGEALAEN